MSHETFLEGAIPEGENHLAVAHKPTSEEQDDLACAVRLVRSNPGAFVDAGRALDSEYSIELLRKRRRQVRSVGVPPSAGPRRKRPDMGWPSDRDRQAPRIVLAVDEALERSEPFAGSDARRVILLTWLMYDETAHTVAPQVSNLQIVPWWMVRYAAAAIVMRTASRAKPWLQLLRRAVKVLGSIEALPSVTLERVLVATAETTEGQEAPIVQATEAAASGVRAETEDLPPLFDQALAMVRLLLEQPPAAVLSSRRIADELSARGLPTNDDDVRSRLLWALRPYGVHGTPKGYRIEPVMRGKAERAVKR